MSSESADTIDEVKDCFVGIDPDDTLEVKFFGATFTVGVIPSGIWQRLTSARGIFFQNAMRRTIARLVKEGINPDELEWTKEKDKVDVTRAVVQASQDPQFREEVVELILEAARFAVRSHSNFKNRHGKEFPCETETSAQGVVLNDKTLRVYRANTQLLDKLWIACHKLNELGGIGKKG